jgi:uncharacterized cupredoxin-like copper-binding protein
MSKFRVATLGLVAAGAVAVWAAVPALGHPSKAASSITVSAGKPSPFSFTLSTKTVKHGTVTFVVKNAGTGLQHDFKINGKKTPLLNPGKSATLTVTFAKAGSYPYSCTVPGHAAAGMKGTLKVT